MIPSEIDDMFALLSEIDIDDVPPTSHPLDVANTWSEDEPKPSLPLEDVFANAPQREDDHFKVPPA